MIPSEQFINNLEELKEGERFQLRRLAGQPLDACLHGFDLFTGLWWPLRARSPRVPPREISWLVAKLWGAFQIPHIRSEYGKGPSLANILGKCEPKDKNSRKRFRDRFDMLLCSPIVTIEPHLRWALSEIASVVATQVSFRHNINGLDWVRLLDDLSIWDKAEGRGRRNVRDEWGRDYLKAVKLKED